MTVTPINYVNCPKSAKIIKYFNNENTEVIHISKKNTGGRSGIVHTAIIASKVELSREELCKPNVWHVQLNSMFNNLYFYEVRFNKYL